MDGEGTALQAHLQDSSSAQGGADTDLGGFENKPQAHAEKTVKFYVSALGESDRVEWGAHWLLSTHTAAAHSGAFAGPTYFCFIARHILGPSVFFLLFLGGQGFDGQLNCPHDC